MPNWRFHVNRLLSRLDEKVSAIGVLILALVVRLMGIIYRPIWYDEAIAILLAEKGPSAMLLGTLSQDAGGAAANVHPLAYHTALWVWMMVFGQDLFSVRMLSILFGIGTVMLAYFLMRAMFNPRLALLGALGVALSPFLVHYSQEIRMYSLLAFFLVAATYVFWQGLHTNQRRWWIIFAFCAALAQYTQNLAVFYLIPLALTPVFLRRWDKVIMTIFAGVGALVLYLPWLVQLPAQFAKIQNAYWVEQPGMRNVITTLLSYVTNLPINDTWIGLALTVTLVVVALAGYQTFLAFRHKLPEARKGLWLAYLAFAPAILMFLFSQWKPVYVERALLPSGVMFWLWLAWALTAAGLPRFLQLLSLGLLALGITLGLVMHLTYRGFPYGPYDVLDASLKSRVQTSDTIVHSNKLTVLPALYFDRSLTQYFVADPPGSATDTLAPTTQQVLGIEASPTVEVAVGEANRVYFIIFQKAIDEATEAGLTTHPQIAWLDAHFRRQNIETWGPIIVYVYAR
jgi:4-amino-4-deoxy-L-arabinose transferase-like glycosyltransferase